MRQVTVDELKEAFTEQSEAMAEAGADAVTMMDLAEAQAAVSATRETGLPMAACMVFTAGKDKDRTMMGDTSEKVAEQLAAAGADVIGSNCGQGIEGFIPICRRMRAVSELPLWMKANAGRHTVSKGAATYDATPDQFARFVPKLIKAGADFVGGCCGTNPEYIAAVAAKIG
ncbi:MAG: homocysteine S-methyltransferase family protein [Thermodesulfobacteriota bacterium]